jgi:hypothetical protein
VRIRATVDGVPGRLKSILDRLRHSFSDHAEDSYRARDQAIDDSEAETFAKGEAHAYGVASDEVRSAERSNDGNA